MKIVFIRHAKSENSQANKRQSPASKLGDEGIKQAKFLAKRIKTDLQKNPQKYDLIMTSPWIRAVETANILVAETGLNLVEHPIIHEHLSNPILFDQEMDSDIVKENNQGIRDKGANLDWKFRGEGESFRDVINRAKSFKDELVDNHKNKNYLVVSHGLFIVVFVTLIILGDNYKDEDFKKVAELIQLEKTSITDLEFDEADKTWKIIILNDYSHLV